MVEVQEGKKVRVELLSEKVERARPYEALLRKEEARRRIIRAKRITDPSIPRPEPLGEINELVGLHLGMSGNIYGMARNILDAAVENPEKFSDLVELMDRPNSTYPAHRLLLERQKGKPKPPPSARVAKIAKLRNLAARNMMASEIAKRMNYTRSWVFKMAKAEGIELMDHQLITGMDAPIDLNRVVEETVLSLEASELVVEMVLGNVHKLDVEQLEYWGESLDSSLGYLNLLKKEIKEARNGKG